MDLRYFHNGRRISFEGNLCTVRYVGPVEGTKGTWLGVEWDDPTRGKHSGVHNGIEYFTCNSKESTAASFIRPTRPHDRPCSLVEALHKRYVSQEPDKENQGDNFEQVINISGKDVEEVGFDKINDYLANTRDLPLILLDGACIGVNWTTIKTEHDSFSKGVAEACPHAADLDLSRNLFEHWEEILGILEQLPKVSRLRVDGNILSDTRVTDKKASRFEHPPFTILRELSIKDGYQEWENIVRLVEAFSSLKVLEVGGNALRELNIANLPATLTIISLERNKFESLEDIKVLARLPLLEKLDLNTNGIQSLTKTTSNDSDIPEDLVFPSALRNLDLFENKINSWHFISALPSIFPGLRSLRVSSNPLYQTMADVQDPKITSDEGFILTVARIRQLQVLNRSQITPKQRLDAEAFYLSQIGKELSSRPEEDTTAILSQHPRYQALCKAYGEPIVRRQDTASGTSNTLASRLLRLTFYLDPQTTKASASSPSWTTEIPPSFTIYNILGILEQHFGLCAMHLRLIWETEEEMPVQFTDLQFDADGSEIPAEAQQFREEKLEPKMRSIASWIERGEATIRVEWDQEEITRHTVVRDALISRLNGEEGL